MITPMFFPVILLMLYLTLRAEASGSLGNRAKVEAPLTLDLSTPAFRQVQPWRVLTMSAVLSARTTLLVLRSTRSMKAADLPLFLASSIARGDGFRFEMSTSSPSLFDTAFWPMTNMSRFLTPTFSLNAAWTIISASLSPGLIKGRPLRGITCSELGMWPLSHEAVLYRN